MLRQYVANPLATEKVEAERLLAEAETAVADALTLDALVAMNDWAFNRAKAAGTIDDGKVTHPVLVSVRAETVQRNLDEGTQRRAAIKERQQAEQLAALERQRLEEQRQKQEEEERKRAEEEERKPSVKYTPQVGAVYVTTDSTVLAATNFLYVKELDKAIKAHDIEGLQQMVRDGNVTSLKAGVTLRILEVHENDFLTRLPFVECTASMGGQSVGKVYLFQYSLDSKHMTPKE